MHSVVTVECHAPALDRAVTYTALVPEAGTPPFAVLYQLHGASDDHRAWLYKSNLLRHVDGLPLIVVLPSGENSYYVDAWEKLVVDDLPAHVSRTFRVREGRAAIGGLSMGGFGAIRLGLKYADRYASIYAHSSKLVVDRRRPRRRGDRGARRPQEPAGAGVRLRRRRPPDRGQPPLRPHSSRRSGCRTSIASTRARTPGTTGSAHLPDAHRAPRARARPAARTVERLRRARDERALRRPLDGEVRDDRERHEQREEAEHARQRPLVLAAERLEQRHLQEVQAVARLAEQASAARRRASARRRRRPPTRAARRPAAAARAGSSAARRRRRARTATTAIGAERAPARWPPPARAPGGGARNSAAEPDADDELGQAQQRAALQERRRAARRRHQRRRGGRRERRARCSGHERARAPRVRGARAPPATGTAA